jgi:rRNA processing protein Gar1
LSRLRAPGPQSASEVAIVLAITPSGIVTARSFGPTFPSEGSRLSSARGAFVGTVARVFGPIDRPYLALKSHRPLHAPEAAALLGASLSGTG